MLTKQETSLGRGPGREQRGEGPREDGSAPGSRSRVYGERVRFGLSVADRSDPGPLLGGGGGGPHRSGNTDSSKERSGRTRGLASPLFGPFPILPVGSDL